MLRLCTVIERARIATFTFLALISVCTSLMAADIEGEVRTGIRPGLQHVATVRLLNGSRIVKETLTDLDGRFDFSSVTPRAYTVRALYPGFTDGEVGVTVIEGSAPTKVSLTLKPVENSSEVFPEVIAADELHVPKQASKEYDEGLKLRQKGDCNKATPHFQKAVSLYARYGSAYNELGLCERQLGRLGEAEAHLRKAIQHSSDIGPSVNLANLYIAGSRLEEAERVIETAIRANPTEGDLFFALARIRLDQGKSREAETAGHEAHSRMHKTADVHLLLARIYLEAKNYPAVITQLETYLVESPSGAAAPQVRSSLSQLRPED